MPDAIENTLNTNSEVGMAATTVFPEPVREREDLSVFFAIGIIVNLTMFVALVVWGYRQWNKNNADEE